MTHAKALLCLASALICTLLLAVAVAYAENVCIADHAQAVQTPAIDQPAVETSAKGHAPYQGILKIYIVEPVSRWRMYGSGGTGTGENYHFGFLGFAANQAITLNVGDTLSNTVTYTGSGLDSHNLMAIAVVFNQEGYPAQSRPGYTTHPFTAHYVDAAIGVNVDEVKEDTVSGTYTHNVFCEEGTGSWCPNCPPMASALNSIYHSGSYPFYFVALIEDKVTAAQNRCVIDYNVYGYPTCWLDGGYRVVVGGYADTAVYTPFIRASGQRVARDLYLQCGLAWVSSTQVRVTYKIHARDLNNLPTAAQPTNNCPMIRVGEDELFLTALTDIDADTIWARYDFGDGDTTGWLGPYQSGESCGAYHAWDAPGTYAVKVQVKDNYQVSAVWSTPKNVVVSGCRCGDSNGDGAIDISDAVFLISHIFSGGQAPGPCECSGQGTAQGDANGDGTVDISDAVYLISHIFSGGAAPHCP